MRLIQKLNILLLFVSLTTFGKTYYEHVNDALQEYKKKNYKASSVSWKNAFQLQLGYSNDYYNAACTLSLAGNKETAFDYLEKAIKVGWDDLEWMSNDKDLALLHADKNWSDFYKKAEKWKVLYNDSFDTVLKNKLESLRSEDQTPRMILPLVLKKFGTDSKEYHWFSKTLKENDDQVLHEVIKIIEKHGWLGRTEVGELANQTLWLVIQHAPLETQIKFLPLLKESVNKGESKAEFLAFLQDRILMRQGNPQIYGTQAKWNKEKKRNEIYPIENIDNVNQLRLQVGLNTIEEYAKQSGFFYLKTKN